MNQNRATNMRIAGAFLLCILIALAAEPAASEIGAPAAVTAIQHRICYEAFWWDRDDFEFGKTVTATVRSDDDMAYAWIDNLEHVPGAPQWASFFTIFTKDNQTAVAASYGYNLKVMKGNPDFEQKRNEVFKSKTDVVKLQVPTDCSPQFSSDDPERKHMLSVIENTIKDELVMFNKNGRSYPDRVQIIISNFNFDYPEAFVFIPSTGDVFSVALHNASAPLTDTYLKEGAYPVQPVQDKASATALIPKIRKYGVVREIHLSAD